MSTPITPQPYADKLARALGLKTPLYLKREDLHPYGSHKGRSIPIMIKKYAGLGEHDFVISSSGNAALAAALYIRDYNLKNKPKPLRLTIFVGKNIDKEKLKTLQRASGVVIPTEPRRAGRAEESLNATTITQTKNPKQSAFLAAKQGALYLRQSTDNLALAGYAGLAHELRRMKNLKAVFIPTSSGTTAVGLFRAWSGKIQIHIVQTDACHPFVSTSPYPLLKRRVTTTISSPFKERAGVRSLASAIVDKVGHRKKEVLEVLKKSNGVGYIATNKEIKNAIKLAYKTEKIKLSPNSALALVGIRQAIDKGWRPNGAVALIITGK